uniref:BT_3987 domain-containing protein n=1 Tax=Pedobacter schmidteae TaxID=2201271 RepID=UPI000EB525D2|nr:DUF1735 domain-containing protein [Pedobacter schmidteae]
MKKILSIFICIIIIGGCKKEKEDLLMGNPDSYSAVYMPQAVNKPAVYSFNFSAKPEVIIYGANFGGPGMPSGDIQVNFSDDATLVEKFNTENFTNYKVMPAGSYSFEQTSAPLDATKKSTAPLKLSVFTDKLDGVGGYLLPVTIKANGNVAINESLKTTYFLISAKYTANPYPLFDNSAWSIVSFSSEEKTGEGATNGRAIYAFDRNGATYWSTEWKNAKPGPPHFIAVDMQSSKKIRGFVFTGRKDNTTGEARTTGNPRDIVIQTSNDGIVWNYSQAFSLPNVLENTVYLDYAQNARFFKVTINASQADNYLTHIAELNAF